MTSRVLKKFSSVWRRSAQPVAPPSLTTWGDAPGGYLYAPASKVTNGDSVVGRGPIDPWLLLAMVLLLLVGEVMVFNTTYFYVGLVVAAAVPCTTYRRLVHPVLALAFVGLLLVLVPGVAHGKVQRWIALGPLNFQPSELAKGAVTLYLAHSLTKKAERIRDFVYGLVPHLLVVGAVVMLIALEPDLGGAVLICLMLCAFFFVSGARLRHLALLAACGLVLLACGIVTARYRSDRLWSFLDQATHKQSTGYQLNQSLLAFGAGGIKGVGLGESRQKMFYLPEAHTDFIFAVVGEETGLWGTVSILSLFTLLGMRGLRVALRHPHPFGCLLAFGCTFLLVCQAGLNMAVVLGMLPTKGLPLPFISYGGSALMMAMVYAGVLLSLSRESRRENQPYA